MSPQNAGRPATARPVNEPPFDLSCGKADNPSYPINLALRQLENTVVDSAHRFRRATARCQPVLAVRIGVRAATSPHGQSREFALSAGGLDELLAIATRMEASR